jgi:hemolysin III
MVERTARAAARIRPLQEEIASALIQGGAAVASAVGLVYLVTRGWRQQTAVGLAAIVVYGASMFLAFLISALYHGVQHGRIKSILRAADHCTIFLFIAGTYTPVALLPLRQHAGGMLLLSIWTLAIAGIVLRLINEQFFRRVAVLLYLVMGWLCLGWAVPLYQMVGATAISLMFAGGLSYTGGLLFYHGNRLPYSTPMWHLCVVAGSASFFLAISRFLQM